MVNFLTRTADLESQSSALLNLTISSDPCTYSTVTCSPLVNSDFVFVSVSTNFPPNTKEGVRSIAQLIFILVLILVIVPRCSLAEFFLHLILLLLLLNFVRGSTLELKYVSLIINIRSSFMHIYFFQLLLLLSQLLEVTYIVSTNKINLPHPK